MIGVAIFMNSPEKGLPGVLPDFEAACAMTAGHLLARGFRHFGHLGFRRGIDLRQTHVPCIRDADPSPCAHRRGSRHER